MIDKSHVCSYVLSGVGDSTVECDHGFALFRIKKRECSNLLKQPSNVSFAISSVYSPSNQICCTW